MHKETMGLVPFPARLCAMLEASSSGGFNRSRAKGLVAVPEPVNFSEKWFRKNRNHTLRAETGKYG